MSRGGSGAQNCGFLHSRAGEGGTATVVSARLTAVLATSTTWGVDGRGRAGVLSIVAISSASNLSSTNDNHAFSALNCVMVFCCSASSLTVNIVFHVFVSWV